MLNYFYCSLTQFSLHSPLFLCLWLRFIPFLLTFIHPRLHWVLLKAWETALWCHRAAREIGRTFMWGFGHHTPWRMAYMRGGLFFQGRLASVFGEDGLPSHLHLFWKPGYPSLQATWLCHSPHKCAILYAPRFYSWSCGILSPVGIDDGAMGLKGERLACPGCPKGYGGQTDCYIFLYGSIFIFLFSYLFI